MEAPKSGASRVTVPAGTACDGTAFFDKLSQKGSYHWITPSRRKGERQQSDDKRADDTYHDNANEAEQSKCLTVEKPRSNDLDSQSTDE